MLIERCEPFEVDDDKLVLVTDGSRIGMAEISRIVHFQEKYFDVEIFRDATKTEQAAVLQPV